MKIACQSCQAKYTIADEKVLGKVVKIRCKKCSATIVINGNESQGLEAPQEGGGVLDFTGPASNEQWTVNVADGDQRTMLAAEIVKEYRAGVITDETYCWKDGMADWLPLREIEQLYGAASAGPRPSLQDADPSGMGALGAGGGGLFGGGEAPTEERHVNGNGPGSPALFGGGDTGGDASPAPAAARRAGGRGGGGADLFGGVAQAGGEEEIASGKGGLGAGLGAGLGSSGAAVDEKLTGQRNENSVLFSLSALTGDSKGGPPPAPKDRTTAQADGSGLIDIRALSANMSSGDKAGKNHVDDIMNLSGGGAFGAALAAPILAPPPMADIPGQPGYGGESENKGNKTLLIGLLGAGGLIAVAIIAAVILLRPSPGANTGAGAANSGGALPGASLAMADPTPSPGTVATGGAAPATSTVAAPASAAPADTSQATLPGQNTKPGQPSGPAPKAFGGGNPPAPKADPGGGGGGGGTVAANTPPAPPKAAGGGSLEDEMRKSAGNPPPPAAAPAAASTPFDRGAAAGALGGVNYQSCKKADGPTGSGHIQITFGPDGNVQTAVVDAPPYAGTPVGGCIAGKFRGAHVPPFAGSPVKVGKTITLN